MEDKLLLSVLSGVVYLLCKLIDSRFISKTTTNPKSLTKDTLYVFASTLMSIYVIEYFGVISKVIPKAPSAFLDEPAF
tara:strand:- start:415 stop:648 length:234 start_codon:yes stop_codon:yes gene_type:complete